MKSKAVFDQNVSRFSENWSIKGIPVCKQLNYKVKVCTKY